MKRLGIHTGADLRQQSLAALHGNFGSAGAWYYAIARAEDNRPVVPDRKRKSSGAETTFSYDLTDPIEIEAGVAAMAEDAWTRCAQAHAFGRTVTVKIKYADFKQATRSRTMPRNIVSRDVLRDVSLGLIRTVLPAPVGIRLVGVTVSGFEDSDPGAPVQLGLALG